MDEGEGAQQLLLAGVAAEAQADARAGFGAGQAEGGQDVARTAGAAGAGGAGGEGDLADLGKEADGVYPCSAEVEVAGVSAAGRAVEGPRRHGVTGEGGEAPDMGAVRVPPLDEQPRGFAEADAEGGRQGSGAQPPLLPAAVEERVEGRAFAHP